MDSNLIECLNKLPALNELALEKMPLKRGSSEPSYYTGLDPVPKVKKLIVCGLYLSGEAFCLLFSHLFPNVEQLSIHICAYETVEDELRGFIHHFGSMLKFEVVESRYDPFRDGLCRYPEWTPGKLATYTPPGDSPFFKGFFKQHRHNFELIQYLAFLSDNDYQDEEESDDSEVSSDEEEDLSEDEESDQLDE